MSAFIVSETTIHALVTYATQGHDRTDGRKPNEVGQILIDQNYRSVNSRYRENNPASFYEWRLYMRPLKPVEVLKLCNCYDYQACETDDYEETEAAKIIERIREAAIRNLPGYGDANWDLPDDDPAARKVVSLSALA